MEGFWDLEPDKPPWQNWGLHSPHANAPTLNMTTDPPSMEYRCFGCGEDVREGDHGQNMCV